MLYPCTHTARPFSCFSDELCLSTYLISQEKQHLGNRPKTEKAAEKENCITLLTILFINLDPCYDISILKPTVKLKQLLPNPT